MKQVTGEVLEGDCLEQLRELEDCSVDMICTDPPYSLSFMGLSWDKAVPSVEVWKECLRVLKPGGFAFVLSAARLDCLMMMGVTLSSAGFKISFSPINWVYASGWSKATNIKKKILTDLENLLRTEYGIEDVEWEDL